jgi:hypothetical protein
MNYDLEIRWGKCRQAFCLMVRYVLTHFHYVFVPADLYIKTIHF